MRGLGTQLPAFGPLGPPPFDPSTLAPDGWYRASYAGVPMLPTASSGASGTNGNLVAAAVNAPLVGVTVNGYDAVALTPTLLRALKSVNAITSFASSTAMTLVVLANLTTTCPPNADFFSDSQLIGDAGGYVGLVASTSGVRAGIYDAVGSKQTAYTAVAPGVWFAGVHRYDGTNVKCRVSQASGTADTSAAAGTPGGFSGTLYEGFGTYSVAQVGAQALEFLMWKRVVSDADLVSLVSYFNTRYALSLT